MANKGFTLAEDAALKKHLSFLSVSDDKQAQRPVKVFFRFPESETEKAYPFVTIDLVDIAFAGDRQLSEVNYYYPATEMPGQPSLVMDYFPSEETAAEMKALVDAGGTGILTTDQFVAVDLTYQVTTYCRSQIHDRQLTMLLLRRIFPMRRGFIDIPEDGTTRRMDLLDWRQSDLLDQETGYKKRIFRKVLTVRINAEIPQADLAQVQQALTVHGTLQDFNHVIPQPTISEAF